MKTSSLERTVGRVLGAGALASVALLAIGIAGMGVGHVAPLDRPFPAFDLGRLPADVAARTAEKYQEAWRRLTQG